MTQKLMLLLTLFSTMTHAGVIHVMDMDIKMDGEKGVKSRNTIFLQKQGMRIEPKSLSGSNTEGDPTSKMMDGMAFISNKKLTVSCPPPTSGRKVCIKTQSLNLLSGGIADGAKRRTTKFEYKAKGTSKKIAGYRCDLYDLVTKQEVLEKEGSQKAGESVRSTLCMAKIPEIGDLMYQYAEREAKEFTSDPKIRGKYLEFKKLGVLLESDSHMELKDHEGSVQNVKSHILTVSLTKKDLSPALFEIPKGYQVIDMESMARGVSSIGQEGIPGMPDLPPGLDLKNFSPEVQEQIKKSLQQRKRNRD